MNIMINWWLDNGVQPDFAQRLALLETLCYHDLSTKNKFNQI